MSELPKRFMIVLAVSLGLNLFFLGLFASRHLVPQHIHPHQEFRSQNIHTFLRRSGLLAAGPKVRDIVETERPNARARIHAVGEARAKAREALQAVPFDGARLDAAFAEVHARTSEMQQAAFATFSRVARELNDAQRKRMADALWARGNHEHRRAHHDDEP
jgi:hypothetical protein